MPANGHIKALSKEVARLAKAHLRTEQAQARTHHRTAASGTDRASNPKNTVIITRDVAWTAVLQRQRSSSMIRGSAYGFTRR